MSIPITRVEFSVRTRGVLERLGVATVGDLLCLDWKDAKNWPQCGKATFAEIVGHIITYILSEKVLEVEAKWRARFPKDALYEPAPWVTLRKKALKYDTLVEAFGALMEDSGQEA